MRKVEIVEEEVELAMFATRRTCAQCGSEMQWDGIMLTSNPPQFRLLCPRECGYAVVHQHPNQAVTRPRGGEAT